LSPDDPERLKPNMLSDRYNNLRKELYKNKNFNIAGDYEISNRGYTEEDKKTV